MSSRYILSAAALIGTVVALASASHAQFGWGAKPTTVPLTCEQLPLIKSKILQGHINFSKETPEVRRRVVELYAKRLDSTKSLLTQSEFDALKKDLTNMFEAHPQKQCEAFAKLKASQVKWLANTEEHTKKILSAKNLKIDRKVKILIDADKRPRPKNKKELAELRRKLVHFQLATYVANGSSLTEAREKLLKRYERSTRQTRQMSDEDHFTVYLNAFANALDPHTTYLSRDALEDFRISMRLSLQGIGATLTWRDGYTIVREIVPGGAADRHGKLRTDDKIIAVGQGPEGDSTDVIDMDLREVVKLIRGKKDTKVRLTVLRQGKTTERLNFTIVRDKIDLKEQAAKLRWENIPRGKSTIKVAVIDLPSFYGGSRPGSRSCVDDVRNLLKQARDGGAQGVVLDLSRNGGGLLSAAVDISGLFLAQGNVVGVKGLGQKQADALPDRDPSIEWSGPLVVLTSSVSASASEILAGALRDYQRAVIVGDKKTFGKGTVQQVADLPRGLGAIKYTMASFYLPGGKSTQADGVASDIIIPSILTGRDISEATQPYALPPSSVTPFLSKRANRPENGYKAVTSAVISKLRKTSEARVKKNKEFQKLSKEAKKAADGQEILKISEILDEAKKNKKDKKVAGDDKPKDKKDEPSLQSREASQILADLITG